MKGKKTLKIFILVMVLLILVCVGIILIKEYCTVTTVDVSGNDHYTEQEIKDHRSRQHRRRRYDQYRNGVCLLHASSIPILLFRSPRLLSYCAREMV